MSKEYLNYLKQKKRKKRIIILIQISIILIFLFLWQLLVNLNIINSFILSSPKNIIETLKTLINNNLFIHIYTTISEVLISFILSMIISIILASILWYYQTLYKIIEPYLTIINSLPKVALGPIILIWFGANEKSIIIMGILISVIVLTLNIYNAFSNVDQNKEKLIKSLTNSRLKLFYYLVFPSNIPTIISNLKICISMSLIGVIMGEFLVSKKGLGYLIMYGSQIFNLDLVMTGIILLSIIATILYYIIYYVEKRYEKTTH